MLDEKIYKISQVGHHFIRKPHIQQISEKQATKLFQKEYPYLTSYWYSNLYHPVNLGEEEKIKLNSKGLNDPMDSRTFAQLRKFSKSSVTIGVMQPLGGRRWHHYYYKLVLYELKRFDFIDDVFKIPDKEKKLSYTFKGIGHGSTMKDLEELGRPDHIYPSQTPSFEQFYYEKFDIHVIIHNFKVYIIEAGKPNWI